MAGRRKTGLALLAAAVLAGVLGTVLYLEPSIEIVMVLTGAGVGLASILSLSPYAAIFLLLFVVMFLNVANYSFLVFNLEGEVVRSLESALIAYLRLPVVALMALYVLARYGRAFGRFLYANWDVVLLGAASFLSVIGAFDRGDALLYAGWLFLSLVAVLAFYFAMGRSVPSARWSEHVAWLLVGANAIMILFGLIGLQSYEADTYSFARTAFTGSNVHAHACAIIIGALLVLDRQRAAGKASRWLRKIPLPVFLVVGGLSVALALLSAKRMSILAVVAVLAAYAAAGLARGRRARTRGIIASVVIVGAFVFVGWKVLPHADYTIHRFGRIVGIGPEDQSMATRWSIFNAGMAVFREHPLFGVGLSNTEAATMTMMPHAEGAGYSMHNTFLAMLVETGLVGLALFVLVLGRSFMLWRRRWTPEFRWNVALFAIPPLLLMLTETNATPGQYMFWPIWLAVLLPRMALMRADAARSRSPGGVSAVGRLSPRPTDAGHVRGPIG